MIKKFKLTLISLITSFTILFPISTYITINVLQNNPNKIKAVNNKEKYIISKKQDITVLLILEKNKENIKPQKKRKINEEEILYNIEKNIYLEEDPKEEKYLILTISPHDNKICLTNIPTTIKTVAQTNEGTPIVEGTLKEIRRTSGANFLKSSIENLTKIEIDKIIKMDENAIDSVLNNLGGVKILSKNENNFEILDSKKFLDILYKNPKFAFSLLKNNFTNKTNINSFFATLSNVSSTDISIYDFQCRTKGFEKLMEERKPNLIYIDVKTKKIENQDTLTQESLKEIEKAYK